MAKIECIAGREVMSGQDVIAITIALGAVVFTVRFLWRTMTGNEGCSTCPTATADKKGESPKLKRTPLVNIEVAKGKTT